MPVSLPSPSHASLSPAPRNLTPWYLSFITLYRLPGQSLSHSVRLLLYWVLPLAWRIPKVLHRPDFDGFIRHCPSIISTSIIQSFFHFPRPHHQPTPRACHQSLHLIIIPTPSLHHPSPLYTQPVNASSCHPFHLPCEPPTRNSITHVLSWFCHALAHTTAWASALALTFHSVHDLMLNSPSGEQACIASCLLPDRSGVWCDGEIESPPFSFPVSPVEVLCFHSALPRCRAGDGCVGDPASSFPLTEAN